MSPRLRRGLLRAWRVVALVGVGLIVSAARSGRTPGEAMPIGVREAVHLIPGTVAFEANSDVLAPRAQGPQGRVLGTILTTTPDGDRVLGYAGPSEALIAIDAEGVVLAARLRRSDDTAQHVADVRGDQRFWSSFAGVRAIDLCSGAVTVDGVSGASLTSAAIVESIARRLARELDEASAIRTGVHIDGHQILVGLFALGGVMLSFHRGLRRRFRTLFQLAAVVGLGLVGTELLALSLGVGFAAHGLPWLRAPGVALLAASAWLVPWWSGRSPYCGQICPHGALQEWIGRAAHGRLPQLRRPRAVRMFLRAVPSTLCLVAVFALVVGMPLDLAGLEAFDAWLLGAGAATAFLIAVVGLGASAFEGMAYCRYGCATGRILALGSTHPHSAARFDGRDGFLLGLLAVAALSLLGRESLRSLIAEWAS